MSESIGPDAAARFGTYLRREREMRGVSLDAVASFTRLSPSRIEDLEAGRWDTFSARVYLRGSVRNYARAIGLDPEETIVRLDAETGSGPALAPDAPISRDHPLFRRRPTSGPVALTTIAAVALAFTAAIWFGRHSTREVDRLPKPQAAAVAPSAPVTTPAAPLAETRSTTVLAAPVEVTRPPVEHRIRIEAIEDAYVGVAVDGQPMRDYVLRSGRTFSAVATETVTIKSGNAGGIIIYADGVSQPPLGPRGAVRTRTQSFTVDR